MTTTKTQLSPAAVREWLNKNAEDLPWTMLGICEGIGAAPGSERAQVHDAVRYCVIAGFLTRTDTRMGPVFQRTGEGMRRVVLTDKQRKERKRAADAKRVGTTSPGAPRPPQATQACAARGAVRAANTPAKAVVMPRERTETVEQFHARGAGADSADGEGSWGGITERALELVLPWPSKDLSPNARVHWRHRSKATKAARQTAVFLAFEAGWKSARLSPGRLHLWIDFYQAPRKVLPDDDNLLLRFKAYRDGIAQVLGIDDKRFISHPFVSNERRAGGQVVVRITGGPAAALKLNGGQGNAG